jgi:hypothetical protein
MRISVSLFIAMLPASLAAATVEDAGYGYQYRVALDSTGSATGFEDAGEVVDTVLDRSVSDTAPSGRSAAVRGSHREASIGLSTTDETMFGIFGSSTATVTLYDTLFFDLRGIPEAESVDVTFRTVVKGSFYGGAQPNFLFIAKSSEPSFQGDSLQAHVGYRSVNNSVENVNTEFTETNAPVFSTFANNGDWVSFGRSVFEGNLTLWGGDVREVDLQMQLTGDWKTSFGDTASADVITSLDYSSASGVFLEPIPLPAAAWFMLVAVGSLLVVRRRQEA